MKWVDTHVHVSAFDNDDKERGDVLADLLAVLDESEADLRFLISCDMPEVGRMWKDPEWLWRGNAFINDLAARSGNSLYGSCVVSPQFPDESEKVLRRAAEEWGFVQFGEVLEDVVDWGLTTPEVVGLVECAAGCDLPVQVHVSTNFDKGRRHLEQLLALAQAVPQAKYVVAHAIGGRMSDYYIDQLGPLVQRGNNFWAEVRDFNNVPALARALNEIGAERLLAGTDYTNRVGPPHLPYGVVFDVPDDGASVGRRQLKSVEDNPYAPGVPALLAFLEQAGATEAQVEAIAWSNAAALYDLGP